MSVLLSEKVETNMSRIVRSDANVVCAEYIKNTVYTKIRSNVLETA